MESEERSTEVPILFESTLVERVGKVVENRQAQRRLRSYSSQRWLFQIIYDNLRFVNVNSSSDVCSHQLQIVVSINPLTHPSWQETTEYTESWAGRFPHNTYFSKSNGQRQLTM